MTTYLLVANVQIDNNQSKNLVRPWAKRRKEWIFAGRVLAGQSAAIVINLMQSAKLHGHDQWAHLKNMLSRLPSHMNSRIEQLVPHRWKPQS